MLPFIEVSHLPRSSSFYSTVTQPLGLRYTSTADSILSPSSLPSITYGLATSPPTPIFELRQVRPSAERPLKLSRVILSAACPEIVRRFQQRAKEAQGKVFTDDTESRLSQSLGLQPLNATGDWRLPLRASETDMDGNIMDVVYIPPPTYPEGYSGSTIRKTSSSEGEISRIMTWNYDVAASEPSPCGLAMTPCSPAMSSPVAPRTSGAFPKDDMKPVIRRTVTTTSTTFMPTESALSPRQNSSGLTAGAVVGTLLGVAAASAAIGAGVAYGAMTHERLRSELEPPNFQRRSTCPEPLGARSQYSEYGGPRDYNPMADHRPAPTLLTRYPHSQNHGDGDSIYDDTRSRHSSRVKPSGTNSEASTSRRPLLLTNAEQRSHVSTSSKRSARTSEMNNVVLAPQSHAAGSRVSGAVRSRYTDAAAAAPSMRRSSTYDAGAGAGAERESYVSSRSHRTASTVRGPVTAMMMQPTAQTELTSLVSRPKTGASRVSQRADSYAAAREGPAASHVSARRVELPMSGVGSSKAGYERGGSLCDIAPSDSISCAGR